MRYRASCTILLKSNIVHINSMRIMDNKIGYHDAINVSIDHNGCAILIFKEMWTRDISAPKTASNSHM